MVMIFDDAMNLCDGTLSETAKYNARHRCYDRCGGMVAAIEPADPGPGRW